MSSHLGVKETVALLEKLRSAIADFAGREDKLNREFASRAAAEAKSFETAGNEQRSRQAELFSQTEQRFQTRVQECLAEFQKRKVRINEAHKTARRKAVEDITEEEGRRKHKLQENALAAERRRERDTAAAAARLEELKDKLGQTAQTYARQETEARRVFGGYRKFRKWLSHDQPWPEPDLSGDQNQLLAELGNAQARTDEGIKRFGRRLLPLFFRFFRLWLLLALAAGAGAFVYGWSVHAGKPLPYRELGAAALGAVAALALHQLGKGQAAAAARALAEDLARQRWLQDACFRKAELHHQQDHERIKKEFEDTNQSLDAEYKRAIREAISKRDLGPRQVDEKALRCSGKNERLHHAKLEQIERDHNEAQARLQQEAQRQEQELESSREEKLAKFNQENLARWDALAAEWKTSLQPVYEKLQAAADAAKDLFPAWDTGGWQRWMPPQQFRNAANFAQLEVDLERLADAAPKDRRLALPQPATLSVPLLLAYPQEGSILFEANKSGGDEAVAAINNIIFRLLSTTPPGKLSFTIFDPVGLGQNFAGLMHLADFEQSHINSRIWTQTAQIEEKLAELNEHMEKVIQMYLRNEYETIAEYNAKAGTIAEKYHFLVVASFPANFSDTAARRLRNIAASGARCGVYTLVHWDQRLPLPQDFVPDELRKNSVCLVRGEKSFELAGKRMPGTSLLLQKPPPAEFATDFLRRVGESSKDANRVEVPFAQIAPQNSDLWTEDTSEELRVSIGRSGATKLQYLAIGKGTRQHALIAGKTGSGKSTLFHVMITNLALWCSPDQVEFFLVDFKKGVEFKCYATRRLPHAKVVAIESDRQFGLSVLERVDLELRRRGDLFRQLGVQDVAGYKRAGGTEAIPRSLLMIDEFQEFFVEEDRISQSAAVLLDRIVRQGRAFGIHVLLGSQTLGGAYTLARATLGQMVIRIALQCNEADAYLIMDQDNPAPRLLSRPGEGIYNDAAGSIEGNSPFQAVWLPDDVRDSYLARIRARADASGNSYPGPFVFEGNAPADVKENDLLNRLFKADSVEAPASARIWLGAPNSIKGPTEAQFQRQSGNNLLIVGQNEEATLAMVAVSLVCLAAQYPIGSAQFVLLDSTPPGSPQREFLDRVIAAIPHPITQSRGGDVAGIMNSLGEDLKNRLGAEQDDVGPATFLLINCLQNYKKLRQEDEFSFSASDSGAAPNPAAALLNLITDGPSRGFHVIATCDTYNNVSRFLARKVLSEFALRVLFQMSASDSASLIDAPDAGTLGMHRALLYNDREGYLETFRPYARPGNEWIEDVAARLRTLLPQDSRMAANRPG